MVEYYDGVNAGPLQLVSAKQEDKKSKKTKSNPFDVDAGAEDEQISHNVSQIGSTPSSSSKTPQVAASASSGTKVKQSPGKSKKNPFAVDASQEDE